MIPPSPHTAMVKVRKGCRDRAKREALLEALRHPELKSARPTSKGVLLEGPGGIVSTHLSGGGSTSIKPLLKDLARVGLGAA